MAKDYKELKKQAVQLRRRGRSYGEIKNEIRVAKSTISLWLRDIPLSPKHRARLYTNRIKLLTLGPNSQRERRAREIEIITQRAKTEIHFPISRQELLLMGSALYWGEGSKGNRCQVTNSDPALIYFAVFWLKEVLNVDPRQLKARLNIYPQQDELLIKKFWSNLTNIPLENFGKSYVKPLSKGYKKNNLYYGTMRIEVPKSSDMRHRIWGWIHAVIGNTTPSVSTVERKWGSLRTVGRPINLS